MMVLYNSEGNRFGVVVLYDSWSMNPHKRVQRHTVEYEWLVIGTGSIQEAALYGADISGREGDCEDSP